MANSGAKSWEKPWSSQEMIGNASNWSLAGDVGLLKHLEDFSEKLFERAEETNDNVNGLLQKLDYASLSLDIVKNEFLSLRNTQFIESRVYEEDETEPAEEQTEKPEVKKLTDDEKKNIIKTAILRGVSVVDKYFDKVEVPASDTEDETDFPSYVLRPKDPYIDRPLPYVMGTDEWNKKWHVGLCESSSDSEAEKKSDKFSDSDSELDLPIMNRQQIPGTSSSSEADLSNRINIANPVANSTFNDSIRQPEMFPSNYGEDYNSVPAPAPITDVKFAEQLAEKLGIVIDQNSGPGVNKRPIQKDKVIGNLFFDEPPPLDDDDLLVNRNVRQGLFSGGNNLFDDLDDPNEEFWGEKKTPKKEIAQAKKGKVPNLFDDDDEDTTFAAVNTKETNSKMEDVQQNLTSNSKNVTGGLFDEDVESDDDLFSASNTKSESSKPFLQPFKKPTLPLFDEEPPIIEPKDVNASPKRKKPPGGVSIFGKTDLFASQSAEKLLKTRRKTSSDGNDEDNIAADNVNKKGSIQNIESASSNSKTESKTALAKASTLEAATISKSTTSTTKKASLFDDDGLFEDDLFSNVTTTKFKSNLFDEPVFEVDEDSKTVDLFATSDVNIPAGIKSETLTSKAVKNVPKVEDAKKPSVPKEPPKKPKIRSLFDDEEDDIFSTKPSVVTKSFSEDTKQDHDDNLFQNDTRSNGNRGADEENFTGNELGAKESQSGVAKPSTDAEDSIQVSAKRHRSLNVSLFDPDPPELDDWDVRSENNLFDDDAFLFEHVSEGRQASSLFDNEPPSLLDNEISSGIIRDGTSRLETDDSFTPFASSSRRLSSDLFNEQQSNDSLFTTKNTEPFSIPSNLNKIPEVSAVKSSSESNLDITPSGISGDLFSDTSLNSSVFVATPTPQPRAKVERSSPAGIANVEGSGARREPKSVSLFADQSSSDNEDLFEDNASKKVDDRLNASANVDVFKVVKPQQSPDFDLRGHTHENDANKSIKGPVNTDLETGESSKIGANSSVVSNVQEPSKNVKPILAKKLPPDVKHEAVDVKEKIGDVQQEVDEPKDSPGKLKHNLNINVGALIPGATPPKRRNFEKSLGIDEPATNEEFVTSAAVPIQNESSSSLPVAAHNLEHTTRSKKAVMEKSVSFDDCIDAPETLYNVTKERAKIPVKRRPSTRKGRMESLRKSVPDFKLNLPIEQPTTERNLDVPDASKTGIPSLVHAGTAETQKEKIKTAVTSTIKTNELRTELSDDVFSVSDDDLFSVAKLARSKDSSHGPKPKLLIANENSNWFDDVLNLFGDKSVIVSAEKDSANIRDTKTFDLFDDGELVLTKKDASVVGKPKKLGLFDDDGTEPTRKEAEEMSKPNLFDDADCEDDIFSTKKPLPKTNLKKSLFDDEVDDDDIFGTAILSDKPTSSKNTNRAKTMVEKKLPKTSNLRKLDNCEAAVDPLNAFEE